MKDLLSLEAKAIQLIVTVAKASLKTHKTKHALASDMDSLTALASGGLPIQYSIRVMTGYSS